MKRISIKDTNESVDADKPNSKTIYPWSGVLVPPAGPSTRPREFLRVGMLKCRNVKSLRKTSSIIGFIKTNKLHKINPFLKFSKKLNGDRYKRHRRIANLIYTACFYRDLLVSNSIIERDEFPYFSYKALAVYAGYKGESKNTKGKVHKAIKVLLDEKVIKIMVHGDERGERTRFKTNSWGHSTSYWCDDLRHELLVEQSSDEIIFIQEMEEMLMVVS